MASVERLPSRLSIDSGRVFALEPSEQGVLIGAANGLFLRNNQGKMMRCSSEVVGSVSQIIAHAGWVWILGSKGVFAGPLDDALSPPSAVSIGEQQLMPCNLLRVRDTAVVEAWAAPGATGPAARERRVFVAPITAPSSLSRLGSSPTISCSRVEADYLWLIGGLETVKDNAGFALMRWCPGLPEPQRVTNVLVIADFPRLVDSPRGKVLLGSNGLFVFDAGLDAAPHPLVSLPSPTVLVIDGQMGWVGTSATPALDTTSHRLYSYDFATGTKRQMPTKTGDINSLRILDGTLWIGAERGLFRLPLQAEAAIEPISLPDQPMPIGELWDTTAGLWAATSSDDETPDRLFLIPRRDPNKHITVVLGKHQLPAHIEDDQSLTLQWTLEAAGGAVAPSLYKCRVLLYRKDPKPYWESSWSQGALACNLPVLPVGDYSAVVEVTDVHDTLFKSGSLPFHVIAAQVPSMMSPQVVLAWISGVVFLVLLFAVALYVLVSGKRVPPLAEWIFRVILSLAAAAFAGVITGFLTIRGMTPGFEVQAGAGLAVFVLVMYVNPPKLLARAQKLTNKKGSSGTSGTT